MDPTLLLLPCFFLSLSFLCSSLSSSSPGGAREGEKGSSSPLLSSHRPFVLVRFPLSAIFPHRRKYTFTQTRQILTAFFLKKIKIWEDASSIRDKCLTKLAILVLPRRRKKQGRGRGSQSVEMGRGERKKKKGWSERRKRRKRVPFTLVRGRYVISGSEETLFLRHHPYFLVFCAFAKKHDLFFGRRNGVTAFAPSPYFIVTIFTPNPFYATKHFSPSRKALSNEGGKVFWQL